jgi:hypothetical protein
MEFKDVFGSALVYTHKSFFNHLNWIKNEENIQFESNGSNGFFLFRQAFAPAFSLWTLLLLLPCLWSSVMLCKPSLDTHGH